MEEKIVQLCNRVWDQLRFGLSESVYRKALSLELKALENVINVEQEYSIPLFYVTENGIESQISSLRVDIIVTTRDEKILIELKTLARDLTPDSKEYGQLNRYAQILQIGHKYLINFSKNGVQSLR